MENENTFYVGLCMAGAVSAGAYTAGVMDYLIEALDEWEKRRGQEDVPIHRVVIPVIGGSSAGGMTSVITARALYDDFKPVTGVDNGSLKQPITSNLFYHSWVDLVSDDMFPIMLGTGDLADGKVYSLLNSGFIEEVAQNLIQATEGRKYRPYIPDKLKLFATMTNLNGFTYDVAFHSGIPDASRYFVQKHNDYACFVLDDAVVPVDDPGWIPLSFMKGKENNILVAQQAAMATGAFPVGLRARRISRPAASINTNSWIRTISAQDPARTNPLDTLNIDGGLINNEPFELIRDVLDKSAWAGREKDDTSNFNQDYNKFRSTILMIDPFPAMAPAFKDNDELMSIVSSTFGTMMGQMRTKPDILINAMSSSDAGQFLISPSRSFPVFGGPGKTVQGPGAIACGSLGGFGGFMNKEFRIHDYFLGRANCEWFLRQYFTVPKDSTNEIFTNGYANVKNKGRFTSDRDGSLQIIPIFAEKKAAPYMPVFSSGGDWPSIPESEITRFSKATRKRAGILLPNLMKKYKTPLSIAGFLFLNRVIAGNVIKTIVKQMSDHGLIRKA
jgi:hypothetical protein